MEWTLSREPEVDLGLRFAAALHRFWLWHGYLADGIGWLERTLDRGAGSPEPRAAALAALGVLARMRGDRERARSAGEACHELTRRAGHRKGCAEHRDLAPATTIPSVTRAR